MEQKQALYEECLKTLHLIAGENAEFQKDQFEAISSSLKEGSKTLLVQKTGWGKSAVYFIAAKWLSDNKNNVTVIVSPLLSLMRNQVYSAKDVIQIETLNSSIGLEKTKEIEAKVLAGKVDVLIVSPERFSNLKFEKELFPILKERLGLFVIDEAHCVSAWGHDFRPDYLMLMKKTLASLNNETSILFCTATADEKVIEDIVNKTNLTSVIKGDLLRESLSVHSFGQQSFKFAIAWFKKNIEILESSGIIYVLTVKRAEAVAQYLRLEVGIDALAYHGRLEPEEREEIENKLLTNKCKVVVATNSLGMGFDKPDLGFIIHLGLPKTLTDYYQQIGRAARKIENAHCIAISLNDDDYINEFFIKSKIPKQPISDIILDTIPRSPKRITLEELTFKTKKEMEIRKRSATPNEIKRTATRLNLDEYIEENEDGSLSRIKEVSTYNESSVEPLITRAEEQYQEVKNYLFSTSCLMKNLLLHFGQEVEVNFKCNKCSSCLDVQKFKTPTNFEIDEIKDIKELEEGYIEDKTPTLKIKDKTSIDNVTSDEDKSTSKDIQYSVGADGYIQHPLTSELREYSRIEGKENGWPAYIVFPKKVCNEITVRRPATIVELMSVPGIGKNKIERYGDYIIETVKKYEGK